MKRVLIIIASVMLGITLATSAYADIPNIGIFRRRLKHYRQAKEAREINTPVNSPDVQPEEEPQDSSNAVAVPPAGAYSETFTHNLAVILMALTLILIFSVTAFADLASPGIFRRRTHPNLIVPSAKLKISPNLESADCLAVKLTLTGPGRYSYGLMRFSPDKNELVASGWDTYDGYTLKDVTYALDYEVPEEDASIRYTLNVTFMPQPYGRTLSDAANVDVSRYAQTIMKDITVQNVKGVIHVFVIDAR